MITISNKRVSLYFGAGIHTIRAAFKKSRNNCAKRTKRERKKIPIRKKRAAKKSILFNNTPNTSKKIANPFHIKQQKPNAITMKHIRDWQ